MHCAERRDRGDDDRGDYLPDVGLAALAPIDVAVRFRRVGPVGRESVRVAVNARPVLLVHFVVVVEGDRGREAEVRSPARKTCPRIADGPGRHLDDLGVRRECEKGVGRAAGN